MAHSERIVEDLQGDVAAVVNCYPKVILVGMIILTVIAIGFMTTIPSQTKSDAFFFVSSLKRLDILRYPIPSKTQMNRH